MTTEVIATKTGKKNGNTVFLDLNMSQPGSAIVLVLTMTEVINGGRFSGGEMQELVDDLWVEEDDRLDTENSAIDGGTDLERSANKYMALHDITLVTQDRDFGLAVETFLEMQAARPPVAAE